jgi:HlyD family secretion protein
MDKSEDKASIGDSKAADLEISSRLQPTPAQPEIKTAGQIAPTTEKAEQTGLAPSTEEASAKTALDRPVPPRARAKKGARKRRKRWPWVVLALLVVGAGVGGYFYLQSTQTDTSFQGPTVIAGNGQPVSTSLNSNGQVQANADLGVTFSSSGTIQKLYKKLGDTVKAGDTLAELDPTSLEYDVKNAQAGYDKELASYNKTIEGATQKDLEVAQAQVDAAKANLNKTVNGTFTAQDVTSAQAAVNSAASKLAELRAGGKPYDITAAQAGISSAQAQLASAKAKLAKTLAGADAAAIASAQATYDQAVANYDKSLSSMKLNITNAQVARDQALNALKNAQDRYNAIYQDNRTADGKLKNSLPQAAIDNETAAFRALQDAQGNFNKADASLNDAKVQLDSQTRSLQSAIDNAKAQLDKTKQGPTQADIAADQAAVASAQATLDNAQQTLAALTPTQADIAAAEANLASAQANLAKLRGGTPDEVAAAEASLKQQVAALEDLKRGTKPNDLAIAKASLVVAQINLDKAKTALANAVLNSPINGTIVKADLVEGQSVTASTTVYQVVDLSALHVDVSVGESDISKIKEGLPVAVNLDGIPNRSFTGKVTFVSSKASVSNNVVSYLVTVTLDSGAANSLREAYPNAFPQIIQQSPNTTGGKGPAATPGVTNDKPASGSAIPKASGPSNDAVFVGPAGAAPISNGAGALAAASGICGYNPLSLLNQGANAATPKPGMTATVTFCLSLKTGVLSVPNRAIKTKIENNQPVKYVEVLVDKATSKIEQRPILSGAVGDSNTEVTGGSLKAGDVIVLSRTGSGGNNNNQNLTGGPGSFSAGGPGAGGGPQIVKIGP